MACNTPPTALRPTRLHRWPTAAGMMRGLRQALKTGLPAAVFGAATATAVQAQSLYYAEVSADANARFGSLVQPQSAHSSLSSPLPFATLVAEREANSTHATVGGYAAGHSAAWSRPEAGGLHLSTVASASVMSSDWLSPSPNASGNTNASTLFRDVFQFVVPLAAPGTPFTVTAQIRVDASVMVDGLLLDTASPSFFNASSAWETRVSMTSGAGWILQDQHQGSCQWGPAGQVCSGTSPGMVDVVFVLYTGANVVFEMSASANSIAGSFLAGPGGASAGASADIGHTLAWGGVQQVRDAGGNPVDTYAMTGMGSGFDFRQAYVTAVPEAPSLMLWLAGLATVAVRRARRRGRP